MVGPAGGRDKVAPLRTGGRGVIVAAGDVPAERRCTEDPEEDVEREERGLRVVTDPDEGYELLRVLSSPMVALTVRRGDRRNGMIANSAVRASLVPGRQHVAKYVFKRHLTHEILAETGRYVLHLLARTQWDEVRALGFESGRHVEDKLAGLQQVPSERTGIPILTRSYAWMECEVANVMDAGPSTFFMGRIERLGRGSGEAIMDSAYFRAGMPADWRRLYEEKLGEAQELAVGMEEMDDRPWRELHAAARKG